MNPDSGHGLEDPPGAAVSHPNIKVAVRPELELAPVVVGERLRDVEEDCRRGRVDHVWVRGNRVAGDHRVSVEIGVVDVNETVRNIVRVENDAQQPALASGSDQRSNIQEGRRSTCCPS